MKVLLPLAAVVPIAAGWYGGPLVHPTSAARPSSRPAFTGTGPVALSSEQLFRTQVEARGQAIFWAGPASGYRYEYTRTSGDRSYVRYLPPGVRAGAPGVRFLVVATYPFPQAYKALKRIAKGRVAVGPGGSITYTRPNDPKSVLLAYPRVPYEIEVYAPSSSLAAFVARSGLVRPVG